MLSNIVDGHSRYSVGVVAAAGMREPKPGQGGQARWTGQAGQVGQERQGRQVRQRWALEGSSLGLFECLVA